MLVEPELQRFAKKVVALLVVFCLIPIFVPAARAQRQSPYDMIKSEAEGVQRFAELLKAYDVQFQALKKKANPTGNEASAVETKANEVRSAVSEYQRNLNSLISKLRGAGKWTAEFDSGFEEVAAQSGVNATLLASIKAGGGPRATLERGLAGAGRLSTEIEQDLKDIKGRKAKLSWLQFSFIPEARAADSSALLEVWKTSTILCIRVLCYKPPCPCVGQWFGL